MAPYFFRILVVAIIFSPTVLPRQLETFLSKVGIIVEKNAINVLFFSHSYFKVNPLVEFEKKYNSKIERVRIYYYFLFL